MLNTQLTAIRVGLRCVIHSQREWEAMLRTARPPADTLPGPDFSREIVVLAALGEQSNAMWSIGILSTHLRGDTAIVTVRTSRTSGGESLPMIISPVQAIAIPRRARNVLFEEMRAGYR